MTPETIQQATNVAGQDSYPATLVRRPRPDLGVLPCVLHVPDCSKRAACRR
jgi:hypothetical protein